MALNFPSNPSENDIYQFGLLTYIFKNGKWVSQSRGASQLPWYSNMEQARAFWKRLAAEAGLNLVDGSFEEGAVLSGSDDVIWWQAGAAIYGWHLDESKTIAAGSSPTNIGTDWIDKSDYSLRNVLIMASTGTTVDKVELRANPSTGYILLNASNIQFSNYIKPTSDNVYTNGNASYRWSVVYAGTSSINTSDETEKTFFDSELSDAVLDVWAGINWRAFKFNDAIAEKGIDTARVHFGLGAQTVKKAFEDAGLDAFKFGLLCYDEWEAKAEGLDENGVVISPALEAGSRYGIRYEEALALEAALQRRTTNRLEARLSALEAK